MRTCITDISYPRDTKNNPPSKKKDKNIIVYHINYVNFGVDQFGFIFVWPLDCVREGGSEKDRQRESKRNGARRDRYTK